jgi:uncharacterized metal-binding protein
MENSKCNCGCGEDIVLTCSGACDLGYISDQVARRLSQDKVRKMNCLVLIASKDPENLSDYKSKNILVIDGCNEDCGFNILKNKGFESFIHFRLTDLGYEKGKTPVTAETISTIYDKAEILY